MYICMCLDFLCKWFSAMLFHWTSVSSLFMLGGFRELLREKSETVDIWFCGLMETEKEKILLLKLYRFVQQVSTYISAVYCTLLHCVLSVPHCMHLKVLFCYEISMVCVFS